MTDIVSFNEFRNNLARHLDRVVNDKAELHVTRHGAQSVVVVDEAEWESITESLYLLSGPNGEHLLASIAQADAGEVVEFDPKL
jgi:antitoxin YefM